MKRELVLGDVHGELEKLQQVFELAKVDVKQDRVISLGDLVDRGPEPFKCIDFLQTVEDVIFIKGNHDVVFNHFITQGVDMFNGKHGAAVTIQKWKELDVEEQRGCYSFFKNQKLYFIDHDNRFFVHAGFDKNHSIDDQLDDDLYWDRKLFQQALCCKPPNQLKMVDHFKEIYIGHTPTQVWGVSTPMCAAGNIWNLDTGSGKGGVLTLMDINTKEYWQA